MAPEQRSVERTAILGALHGEITVLQGMLIRDISLGGIRLETGFPLQLDSLHQVRLTLGESTLVVTGRVVHSHVSDVDADVLSYNTGIEFVELSDAARTVVLRFIDQTRASRRAAALRFP